jgi:ABC-type phosphate/phosphonate transport system substrate-binding protein
MSGGHLKAIRMVYEHRVDGAAVSSIALNTFRSLHPECSKKIHTLTSWGPLPVHPIVVNSRLPGEYGSDEKISQQKLYSIFYLYMVLSVSKTCLNFVNSEI